MASLVCLHFAGVDAYSQLLSAFAMLQHHPPLVPYHTVCHSLGMLLTSDPTVTFDPWEAAFYFTEAQGVTFRHKSLHTVTRKLRLVNKLYWCFQTVYLLYYFYFSQNIILVHYDVFIYYLFTINFSIFTFTSITHIVILC